ncbi:MAG: MmgE/PrpD family protein [Pseudomonadota bacterium]
MNKSARGLTRDTASFCVSLRHGDIPAAALPVIRTGFTDCIATMVAARHDEPATLLRQVIDPPGGPCNVLFGLGTARPADAAWLNATAGHTLDFDDTSMKGHPSVTLVHAILAEAQALGADGKRMAAAYAVGFEVWGELVRREPDSHEFAYRSFHPTGMYGAIAAAAACASMLELDEEQAVHALAIGASQSAGLFANFGSHVKPFHAGRAAQSGVLAARLAQAGFKGSVDALEHPKGFLRGMSPKGAVDTESPAHLGREWAMVREGQGIKKYPACYASHRAVDAMLDLVVKHDIAPAQVERISVTISDRDRSTLCYSTPQTELQAKFSMQFPIVAALVARRCSLLEFNDELVQRPDIRRLMERVEVHASTDLVPGKPGHAQYHQVVVDTRDGQRFEQAVEYVRGGPEVPLAPGELFTKFESCMAQGWLDAPARPLFDALMRIDSLAGTSDIYSLAQPV